MKPIDPTIKPDPFWGNLRTYDDSLPPDLAERHDDYLYRTEAPIITALPASK
jgi:hypothetical protein